MPVECLHANVAGVSVEVAHNEDIVSVPAAYHRPVYVHQCLHLLRYCVRVRVDRYQHQLPDRWQSDTPRQIVITVRGSVRVAYCFQRHRRGFCLRCLIFAMLRR